RPARRAAHRRRVLRAGRAPPHRVCAGTPLPSPVARSAPRRVRRPRPPIWVGGSPGTVSSPALRRVVLLGDAWHPLALSLADIEKGIATIRELAGKAGRTVGFAPRNMLALADKPKGAGRGAFEASVGEVA